MEIKINREIQDYKESLFFGLSMRQSVFSALAIGVAVGLYFLLKPVLGMETVSWVCILGAAPFAALGFFRYHGMTAEQFLWAWLRFAVLEPRKLPVCPDSLRYKLMNRGEVKCRESHHTGGLKARAYQILHSTHRGGHHPH